MPPTPEPVTVAVLTFHRHAALAHALPAVVREVEEVRATGRRADVVVVDNDPAGGAADVVRDAGAGTARHVVEPRPGIAAGRNRAISEAGDGLLVFVDDDEVPSPGWLPALVGLADRTGAAGVAGPVVSHLPADVDPWIVAGGFFARRHRDAVATGDRVEVAASNNLLLRLAAVERHGLRFAAAAGAGGEDSRFTGALSAAGEAILWCREAVVEEWVPAERLTRRYAMSRAFTTGNVEGLVVTERDGAVDRTRGRVLALGRGGVRLLGGLARVVVGSVIRSLPVRATGARTAARGAGMVLGACGVVHRPYRPPTVGA